MSSVPAVAIGSDGRTFVNNNADGHLRVPISQACCVGFSNFNWKVIDPQLYGKEENVSLIPFTDGLQNVDTFGCANKRRFRFRQVVKEDEATKLSEELNSDVLSADKV